MTHSESPLDLLVGALQRAMSENLTPTHTDQLNTLVALLGEEGAPLAAIWLPHAGGLKALPQYVNLLKSSPDPLQEAFMLVQHVLTARQQALLAAAGVFAPDTPFPLDIWLAVWGGEILSDGMRDGIQADIAALVPALVQSANPEQQTYQISETVCGLVAAHTWPSPAAHARHLTAYQSKAEGWKTEVIREELGQFQRGLEWASASGHDHLPEAVLSGGQALWTQPAYHGVVRDWLDLMLGVARQHGDGWGQAGQMRALGDLGVQVRHFHTAREFYFRALMLYDAGKSLAGSAHTFKGLGDLALAEDDLNGASSYYFKALLMYEEVKFELGQANTLKELATLHVRKNELKDARTNYEKALLLYKGIDFQMGQAETHRALGDLFARSGDTVAAHQHYAAALEIFGDIEFWSEQAATWLAVGDLLLKDRPTQGAVRAAYDTALSLMERAGDRLGRAEVLRALGNLCLRQGRMGAALAYLRESRDAYQGAGLWSETVMLNQLMAHLRFDQGYPQEAARLIHEAVGALHKLEGGAPVAGKASPTAAHAIASQQGARNRLKALAAEIGADFPALWASVSEGDPLPGWLIGEDEPRIPESLTALLQDGLSEAMAEGSAAILKQVAALPPELRAFWLIEAIGVLENTPAHASRALLLKELASVPGQDMGARLHAALHAYDAALEDQRGAPPEYARLHNRRVALLRDMAGLPGENRAARLYQALEGCDSALQNQADDPSAYANTQMHRANLLRELAGLHGERAQRPAWMFKALAAYDEVLTRVPDTSLDYGTAQTNRASLLQEIATLPGENRALRLREALDAAFVGLRVSEAHGANGKPLERAASRLLANIRETIIDILGDATFNRWWEDSMDTPQPQWG